MKKFCPICKEVMTGQHLKKCAKKYGIEKSYEDLRWEAMDFNYWFLIKDVLREYQEGYSVSDISQRYDVLYCDIVIILEHYEIKLRGIKESRNEKSVEKGKKTCLENFGVENPSQCESIKEQKRETFTKNFGVDNVFKAGIFIEWLEQFMLEKYGKKRITNPEKISAAQQKFTQEEWELRLEKIRKTCELKFGYDNYSKVPERRDDISKKAKIRWENYTDDEKARLLSVTFQKAPNYVSKLEIRIQELLNELQIEYTTQKFFKRHSYDFFIEEFGIVIEINGDFWHANPKFYKSDDLLPFPGESKLANEIWEKDVQKKQIIEDLGFRLIIIWEDEMKCTNEELVRLLISKLENNEN